MADEAYDKAMLLKMYNDKLKAVQENIAPAPSAPEGAFTDMSVPPPDLPPPIPKQAGVVQRIADVGVPLAASMAASTAASRAVAGAEIAGWPGAALAVGLPMAAAGVASFAGKSGMDLVKLVGDLPGKPDSISESLSENGNAALWDAAGEGIGQVAGKVTTSLMPYRKVLKAGDEEFLRNHARRIREAYAEIGGKPLVEDARSRWNIMRVWRPIETELDDASVVQRLREAGLDPESARNVALTGGLLPSEIPQTSFNLFRGISKGAKIPPDVLYNRTRTQLGLIAGVREMGIKYADILPPGDLGKLAKATLQGQMRALQGGRDAARNTLEDVLSNTMNVNPSVHSVASPHDLTLGYMINTKALKNMFPITSSRFARDVLQDLDDMTSFGRIQDIRDTLSHAVQNEMLPQIERDAASKAIKRLDAAVTKDLPQNVRPLYKNLNDATDDVFSQQYNTAFLSGLLNDSEDATKFAEFLIETRDPGLFQKLEKALKHTVGGDDIIASVKGHIGTEAVGSAVNPAGIINPKNLPRILHSQEKGYGREFLMATLGPKYMDHFDEYYQAMTKVDKAADVAAGSLAKGRVFGIGGAASLVSAVVGAKIGWGPMNNGLSGAGALIIANALWQPEIVTKALASPKAAKLLVQTAERLSSGYSPKTTARLAARVFTSIGVEPMEYLRRMGLLPPTPEQLEKAKMAQRQPGATLLASPSP
jgi:hypothetical protein